MNKSKDAERMELSSRIISWKEKNVFFKFGCLGVLGETLEKRRKEARWREKGADFLGYGGRDRKKRGHGCRSHSLT